MITITFPDQSKKEVKKGITGLELAKSLSNSLAKIALGVVVNKEIYDLTRPIEVNANVTIVTWKDKEGKHVLWHSAAHILAQAIKELYPESLNTIGPAIEDGFYYDFDNLQISTDDFPKIEKKMMELAKKNVSFVRKEVSADKISSLLKNKYKKELIKERKDEQLTMYQHDNFIDLCKGPHLPNTSYIKAVKLTKLAGAYWKGDSKNKQLTRIYGVAFPKEKLKKEYEMLVEQAKKRDHRVLGKKHALFMFHEFSPGSPFLLPKGTVIYNELLQLIRSEYQQRNYHEVISPQLFNKKLWELSGHWKHYKENMFTLKVDNEEFSLKPMNCPSHVLIFKSKTRSYKELPWRVADFCMVHRNELKGVLTGLTRVRKFSQDDAHIFCSEDQIEDEIHKALEFTKYIYEIFNFTYTASLSTKPEKAMGDAKLWSKAEAALRKALEKAKMDYIIKEGEGAFYGPKIDFDVKDALNRDWQLGTIQLDFQMPKNMKAEYEGHDGKKHIAVMIHRAIFGSLERFIGVIIEHFEGKFPLWLAPVQVRLLTIADRFNAYAEKVAKELRKNNMRVEIDSRAETLNKKIREAQLELVPYICVIGKKEVEDNTINIRTRDNVVHGTKKISDFIHQLKQEIKEKKL